MSFIKTIRFLALVIALLHAQSVHAEAHFEAVLEYDPEGNLETLALLGGSEITMGHTAQGATCSVDLDGQAVIERTRFDRDGSIAERQYATQEHHRGVYTYDDLGRRFSMSLERDLSPSLYRVTDMKYNEWGFLSSYFRDGTPAISAATVTLGYSAQGQVSSFAVGSAQSVYQYDARGNLLSRSGLAYGSLKLPPFAASGGYDEITNQPWDPEWEYDNQGRLIRDDEFRYRYDAAGRLALLLDALTEDVVAHYLYNSSGERVRILDDEKVTYTLRASGAVTWEEVRDPVEGDLIERKTYVQHEGKTVLLAREAATGFKEQTFRFADRLGNPVVRWNDTGVSYQEYSPFGTQLIDGAASLYRGSHGFTGHEDDPTGRTYMRARYYDPVWARFNRPDPGRDFDPLLPSSFNLYQYARNNPSNYVDLAGEQVSLLIRDNSGESLVYHVALRVTGEHNGEAYDYTFDFGPAARNFLEGPGLLRIWEHTQDYLAEEEAYGKTLEYVVPIRDENHVLLTDEGEIMLELYLIRHILLSVKAEGERVPNAQTVRRHTR